MLNNNAAYKYETPYIGLFLITRCCTNVTVTIKYGTRTITHNIRQINPNKYDKTLKILILKLMIDDVNI